MKYFETSAKNDMNVELIFKEIAGLILSSNPEKLIKKDNFGLKSQHKKSQRKKNCCNNK